jgi:hypothetical protein
MKHSNLVIKQQKSRLWYSLSGFSILLLLVLTYFFGRYLAINDLAITKENLALSQQLLQDSQQGLQKAEENLVMQEQSAKVDTQSNQELVNNVKSLQQANLDLEEELNFYRKIMAPEKDQEGLTIDDYQITQTEIENELHYRVTLIQAGKQAQFLKGNLSVTVSGVLDGESKEYNFRELGTFNIKHFQFQFKYFQNLQGFIQLPKGFQAKKIRIVAQTTGRRKNQKANKEAIWQPEESQKYVR